MLQVVDVLSVAPVQEFLHPVPVVPDGRVCAVSRLVFEEQLNPGLGIERFEIVFIRGHNSHGPSAKGVSAARTASKSQLVPRSLSAPTHPVGCCSFRSPITHYHAIRTDPPNIFYPIAGCSYPNLDAVVRIIH